MKNRLAFIVLMVMPVACNQSALPDHEKEIDNLVSPMVKPGGPGCTIAVAKAGKVLFSKGYGSANPEYDIRNTPTTIFHVASVSKQFTAFAIALLADQGKIALDDDIHKYLPELHDFGHKITINHLVHHTSGLRDQWDLLCLAGWRMDDVITRSQVLRLMSHQEELNAPPGQEFNYCNTGYTLLAEIVSRVSGQSFPAWCSKNIFQPLGMDHTLFYDDHEKIVKGRAYSFQDSPDGLKKSVLSYAVAGATSLFTTAEDLTKWSNNFYAMKIGNASVMKQMEERGVLNSGDTISYAFGQSMDNYKGLKAISHSGGDAGYRSFLLRFPKQEYSIVVLSNFGSFNPAKVAYGIAEIYLKDSLKEVSEAQSLPASASPVSETLLKTYEGKYELNDQLTVSITRRDGKLIAQATGQQPITLTASNDSVFFFKDANIKIIFNQKGDSVNRFTLYQGGQVLAAPRMKPFNAAAVDLKAFEGTYYSRELQTSYTLLMSSDTLRATHIRHEPAKLTPVSPDAFTTDAWYMSKIEFTRGGKGEVTGFRASSGRVKNVRFEKREM